MTRPWTHGLITDLSEESRLQREVEEDIADSRGLSGEERAERIRAVCESGWIILRARPDFERAIAWRDPLPDDFEDLWQGLMKRHRAQKARARQARRDP